MITVKGRLGNSVLTGITFNTIDSVEEVTFLIGCDDVTSQIAHTINNNRFNKNVTVDSLTENLASALTFSILFQSDDLNDIIVANGTYFALKNVLVEVIP